MLDVSFAENVVNKRGKMVISIQYSVSVKALSKTKGRHDVQGVDGSISIT